MSGRIQVNMQAANSHRSAISGSGSSFNASFTSVTGGTAPVVSIADGLGASLGGIAREYALILPTSANDIVVIANAMAQVDAVASTSFSD